RRQPTGLPSEALVPPFPPSAPRSSRMNRLIAATCLAAVAGLLAAQPASAQPEGAPALPAPALPAPALPAPACQRECLESFVDRYLQAMADGTAAPSLFAAGARFAENGVEMPLGNEGLWATASGVGRYKFYVPDVETQQVAFLGTVMEQAPNTATG